MNQRGLLDAAVPVAAELPLLEEVHSARLLPSRSQILYTCPSFLIMIYFIFVFIYHFFVPDVRSSLVGFVVVTSLFAVWTIVYLLFREEMGANGDAISLLIPKGP
jgi:hypothetical protein